MATTHPKLVKSLDIILEMLEKRSETHDDWKKAHEDLRQKKKQNEIEFDESPSLLHIDLGWLRIIYDLEGRWDTTVNNSIRELLQTSVEEDDVRYFIFVLTHERSKSQPSLGKTNELNTFVHQDLKKKCDIFHLNELQYNVTKHVLVSPHDIIHDDTKKKAILKKYSIQKFEDLPYILSTDPVVRFIGAKPGDLVRITRYLENAGDQPFYRYCVSA